MPRPGSNCSRLSLVLLMLASTASARGDEDPTPALDPARVYRFDPLLNAFEPIDRTALKPLHVYRRYSPQLGRWVWSKTMPDGRLAYAMGPGSVQQTWLFDLKATMEERRRVLEERAPEVARLYAVQGARAAVILRADDTWALHGVQSLGHVYDLETGHRWEWHGDHHVAVAHSGGNNWLYQDGRFVPAFPIAVAVWEPMPATCCDDGP